MGAIGRTKLTGTTFFSPTKCHLGLNLFAPMCGKEIFIVNMVGKIIHKWDIKYNPGYQVDLLPNGNIMYAGKIDDGPLADKEGAGGILQEVDINGDVVWEHRDPYHHHAFCRLKNGNMLYPKWIKVPKEIAEKVEGGLPGFNENGDMWGDAIVEIDVNGNTVWEWVAHEHLDPQKDTLWPVCNHAEWTHISSIDVLDNGDLLLNSVRTSSIFVISKSSGEVILRWGKDELSMQNWATVTEDGNFLIFDNGWQSWGEGQGFSRVLEFNPKDKKVVWGYEEDPPHFLFSSFLGSCQRLPNGNTVLLEGTTGRMMELNQKGEMVWEYVNPHRHYSEKYGYNGYIFNAKRYGLEYEGLRKFYGLEKDWIMWNDLESNKKFKQEEPKQTQEPSMEDLIRSRLEPLGY